MKYDIYCDTCDGKLITTVEANPGDLIDAKLDPVLKDHMYHKIHYHEALK